MHTWSYLPLLDHNYSLYIKYGTNWFDPRSRGSKFATCGTYQLLCSSLKVLHNTSAPPTWDSHLAFNITFNVENTRYDTAETAQPETAYAFLVHVFQPNHTGTGADS